MKHVISVPLHLQNAIYIIGQFSKRRKATQTVLKSVGNAECGRDEKALQKSWACSLYVCTSYTVLKVPRCFF